MPTKTPLEFKMPRYSGRYFLFGGYENVPPIDNEIAAKRQVSPAYIPSDVVSLYIAMRAWKMLYRLLQRKKIKMFDTFYFDPPTFMTGAPDNFRYVKADFEKLEALVRKGETALYYQLQEGDPVRINTVADLQALWGAEVRRYEQMWVNRSGGVYSVQALWGMYFATIFGVSNEGVPFIISLNRDYSSVVNTFVPEAFEKYLQALVNVYNDMRKFKGS